jgi:hypothetical protein
MSISIGGSIRNTVNLGGVQDAIRANILAGIREAEHVGRQVIEQQTPKDTRALVTTAYSHMNQSSVIFGIAGTINGKPYGFAQEYGWHDRGGNPHPGKHMIRDAGKAAAESFIAYMGGTAYASGAASLDLEGGIDLSGFQRGLAPVGRGSLGYFGEDLQPYADTFG